MLTRWRRARIPAAVFLLTTFLAGALEWRSGAWHADLSAYPDESSHYVTALAFHSYLHEGLGQSPISFLRAYYASFPRVAVGHWPPVFYLALALIPFSFSTSVQAVLLFQAAIIGAASVVTFFWLRRDMPDRRAAVLCLLLPIFSLVAQFTRTTMTEPLLVFWVAATGLAMVRYLEVPCVRRMLAVAVLVAACLLTKPNGALLVLVLPMAMLLLRRWDIVRLRSFWITGLVILTPAVLWYAIFWKAATRGWEGTTDIGWLLGEAAPRNLLALGMVGGWVLVIFACAGIVPLRVSSAVALSTIAAALVFHTFIAPTTEPRHLIVTAVPLLVLAGSGVTRVARVAHVPWMLAVALFTLPIAYGTAKLPPKVDYGATRAAEEIWQATPSPSAVFVEGNPEFEGSVIGLFAARSHKPDWWTVYRSGKTPVDKLNMKQIEPWFQALDVKYVILQSNGPRVPDNAKDATAALRLRSDRWREIPADSAGKTFVLVFERKVRDPLIPAESIRQEP